MLTKPDTAEHHAAGRVSGPSPWPATCSCQTSRTRVWQTKLASAPGTGPCSTWVAPGPSRSTAVSAPEQRWPSRCWIRSRRAATAWNLCLDAGQEIVRDFDVAQSGLAPILSRTNMLLFSSSPSRQERPSRAQRVKAKASRGGTQLTDSDTQGHHRGSQAGNRYEDDDQGKLVLTTTRRSAKAEITTAFPRLPCNALSSPVLRTTYAPLFHHPSTATPLAGRLTGLRYLKPRQQIRGHQA